MDRRRRTASYAATALAVLEIHRVFYDAPPESLKWVQNPETGERSLVIPGPFRSKDVEIGRLWRTGRKHMHPFAPLKRCLIRAPAPARGHRAGSSDAGMGAEPARTHLQRRLWLVRAARHTVRRCCRPPIARLHEVRGRTPMASLCRTSARQISPPSFAPSLKGDRSCPQLGKVP